MINFYRPANREESAAFFAEHPSYVSMMKSDNKGDYVAKRDFEAVINKYRNALYETQEKIEALQNEIKSLIDETYADYFPPS